MLGILPLLDITLSIRVSFFFLCLFFSLLSLLCVYLLSFSISAFFFLFLFFPLCVPLLFIERFQRSCSLIFLSTDQIMEQFSSVFPPQLLISCWAVTHFSASFLFYLFRTFLNFPFLACDTPTFQLFRSTFIKPCSLLSGDATSLFTFQLLFLFYFLCLSFAFVLGSRLWTWLILLLLLLLLLYIVVLARCRPYMTTFFLNLCYCLILAAMYMQHFL